MTSSFVGFGEPGGDGVARFGDFGGVIGLEDMGGGGGFIEEGFPVMVSWIINPI